MYLSFLFLTFASGLISGLLGRKIGATGAHFIAISCLSIATIISIMCLYEVSLCNSPVTIDLGSWIDIGYFNVTWSFLFDSLSMSLLACVLFVSTFVHLFSVDYLAADPHQQRFFSYLSFFTFFMLILVAANNYLVLFVGFSAP